MAISDVVTVDINNWYIMDLTNVKLQGVIYPKTKRNDTFLSCSSFLNEILTLFVFLLWFKNALYLASLALNFYKMIPSLHYMNCLFYYY
jgi:hypothetical protein